MSHPYGSFSGRGSQRGCQREGERNERPQSGSSHFGQHGRSRGRSRGRGGGGGRGRGGRHGPPPGLTGKQIGLYYRDKHTAKRETAESPAIQLPHDVEDRLESVLKNCKGFYNNDTPANDANDAWEDKYTHISDSHFKQKFVRMISGNIQDNLMTAMLKTSMLERNEELDKTLLEELKGKQSNPEYERMLKFRLKLPAYQMKKDVSELVRDNQVVVISGETGCGKTTQVAQFLLDEQIEQGNGSVTHIICTQPRRISTISVAERVAAERAERLGKSVGFQIRLEKVLARDRGSILFCTTGMLLQFMQSDPALRNFSHIILDEIHERSTESDFIITLLRQIIPKRPDLKVLLMSATLNSESFSKYYDNCPMINIPGFTYKVEELYLEDVLAVTSFKFDKPPTIPQDHRKHMKRYQDLRQQQSDFLDCIGPYARQLHEERKYPWSVIDELKNPNSEVLCFELIEALIRHICHTKEPGAILVFLPGMMDIIKLNRLLLESGKYPESKYIIYPLHSRMPTVDQKLIFLEPPAGVRKIIIATSIAETSITIEDVVYVIDSGRTKYQKFDIKNNIQTLLPEWVSLANAKQRRGRAGRVKPGYCYHLYSKAREMTFEQYPLPEMLRTCLEQVILHIKILQLGKARSFLASVMDPPDAKVIDVSLNLLRTLNALDDDEHLTPLGYHLAKLPLDPRTGKMIIWAAIFSCAEPVFSIAASLNFKDAFHSPIGKEEMARKMKVELSSEQYSDHIALAEALKGFEGALRGGHAGYFCRKYFASFNILKLLSDMKRQFAQHLHEMQFLESDDPSDRSSNRNSHNFALVKAIVCAGLYPNIATIRVTKGNFTRAWTPEDGAVYIHPSSVNHRAPNFPSPFVTYYTKQKSRAIYLHDTTCVTAPILLFAAPKMSIEEKKETSRISLASHLNFPCKLRTAQLIQKLQEVFNNILKYKITHPGTICWSSHEGHLLNAIIELVSQRDEGTGFSQLHDEEDESVVYDI